MTWLILGHGDGGKTVEDPLGGTGDGIGDNPVPQGGGKPGTDTASGKDISDGTSLAGKKDHSKGTVNLGDNTGKAVKTDESGTGKNSIDDPGQGSGETLNTEQKDKLVIKTRKPEKQPTDNPPVSGGETDPGKQTETTNNETANFDIEGSGAGADPSLTVKPTVSDQKPTNDTSKTETDKIVPEVKPTGESPGPVETETPAKEKDEDIIKNKETKKPEGETTKITQKPEKTPKAGEHPQVTEKPKETKKGNQKKFDDIL